MTRSFALSIDSPAAVAVGSPTIVEGVPVQRFVKKVINDGHFVKRDPKTKEKLWELDVNPARRELWAATFKAMKTGGVPVRIMDETGNYTIDAPKAPLTTNHAGAWDTGGKRLKKQAEAAIGETVDMIADDDGWLSVVQEVKGQANIDLVKRSKFVSPEIDYCFIDGTDKKYGEAITAVSIVANPLIPCQTGFETIAASADSPVRYVMSLDNGESDMLSAALVAAIALAAGVDTKTITDEASAVSALGGVKSKLDDTQAKLTKALSSDEPEVNPSVRAMAARAVEKELDGLKGFVSDAGIKALKDELVGDRGAAKYSTFIMSHDEPEQAVVAVEKLVKIIRENPGVKKGEKTALPNTKALSSDEGEGEGNDALHAGINKLVDAAIKANYPAATAK